MDRLYLGRGENEKYLKPPPSIKRCLDVSGVTTKMVIFGLFGRHLASPSSIQQCRGHF